MKENLKDSLKKINDFFSEDPSSKMQSWSLLNDFYHLLLTYLQNEGIKQSELAERMGVSRAAISQLFNRKPNITLNKIAKIAQSIGLRLKLTSEQVERLRVEEKIVIKFAPIFVSFNEMPEIQLEDENSYPHHYYDKNYQLKYN